VVSVARHFLGLYLLIVVTLAAVSWGQDRLLQVYSTPDIAEDKTTAAAMAVLADRLREAPSDSWKAVVAGISSRTGVDMELFSSGEIAGGSTLERLNRGENAYMRSSSGDAWVLKRIDRDHVLALRSREPPNKRGPLEWAATIVFYALIALVLMFWIWPLTRDLRALERAAAQYGNRNWRFAADIKPHSQIYRLAETFRRMAARIDGLIASHKDMSNAVSHEIKTPLSRMQFEIELAQQANSVSEVKASLENLKADIDAIDGLVKATLGYAILERADLTLNLAAHNFTSLIPAIVDSIKQTLRTDLEVTSDVQEDATQVVCDVHLFETVLKNLLYNASRYASGRVKVSFTSRDGLNELLVEDDGPGIPERERSRVFQSFVQLDPTGSKKVGYGLGLAIVKRAIEWHGGRVYIGDSSLGGASVGASWPVAPVEHR
jgi:two-component system, OmpR family, sensor kinase